MIAEIVPIGERYTLSKQHPLEFGRNFFVNKALRSQRSLRYELFGLGVWRSPIGTISAITRQVMYIG